MKLPILCLKSWSWVDAFLTLDCVFSYKITIYIKANTVTTSNSLCKLPPSVKVSEVIQNVGLIFYKKRNSLLSAGFAHVMEQMKAFFLPIWSSRYIQLLAWVGVFDLYGHSCPVRGYLLWLCPTALSQWPLLFPLLSASTFLPQEQIQDSSGHESTSVWWAHSLHSCTPPLWARGCCPSSALQLGQTELCVPVDKHVSLWVPPSLTVFIQGTMPLCWLHRLQWYGRSCLD